MMTPEQIKQQIAQLFRKILSEFSLKINFRERFTGSLTNSIQTLQNNSTITPETMFKELFDRLFLELESALGINSSIISDAYKDRKADQQQYLQALKTFLNEVFEFSANYQVNLAEVTSIILNKLEQITQDHKNPAAQANLATSSRTLELASATSEASPEDHQLQEALRLSLQAQVADPSLHAALKLSEMTAIEEIKKDILDQWFKLLVADSLKELENAIAAAKMLFEQAGLDASKEIISIINDLGPTGKQNSLFLEALDQEKLEIALLLLNHGAKINVAKSNDGINAIHMLAMVHIPPKISDQASQDPKDIKTQIELINQILKTMAEKQPASFKQLINTPRQTPDHAVHTGVPLLKVIAYCNDPQLLQSLLNPWKKFGATITPAQLHTIWPKTIGKSREYLEKVAELFPNCFSIENLNIKTNNGETWFEKSISEDAYECLNYFIEQNFQKIMENLTLQNAIKYSYIEHFKQTIKNFISYYLNENTLSMLATTVVQPLEVMKQEEILRLQETCNLMLDFFTKQKLFPESDLSIIKNQLGTLLSEEMLKITNAKYPATAQQQLIQIVNMEINKILANFPNTLANPNKSRLRLT